MLKVEKTPDGNAKNSEKPTRWCVWNVFILWDSKKSVFTYLREIKIFFKIL